MSCKSSAAKLHNDVLSYEKESDKYISRESYYIIKVSLSSLIKKYKDILKEEASKNFGDEFCLAVYMFQNSSTTQTDIYILFSSLENSEHYFGGSHHQICSAIVSRYALKYNCNVGCSIIVLDARLKVLIYFQTKIYEYSKLFASKFLKSTDAKDMTIGEIEKSLSSLDPPIVWKDVDTFTRHGIFYKYNRTKGKYSYLSELINSENLEKFRKYLFGSV